MKEQKRARAVTSGARAAGLHRKLIRNATVLTLDPSRGILPQADILIVGDRIKEIAPNLSASDAEIIDASNMIAMPGFVDSHRHMWQGAIRQQFPNQSVYDYFDHVLGGLGPRYRPEDVYIGNLVSALGAIDAGVTTVLDWSSISNSPQHSDAAIEGLKVSGIRAVYAFAGPQTGISPWIDTEGPRYSEDETQAARYPSDIRRLRPQYFSTEDQLLTLALGADGPDHSPVESAIAEWEIAREVGARISVHMAGNQNLAKLVKMKQRSLLKPDTTYLHCIDLSDEIWEILKETGASVSISSSAEMEQGFVPAIQEALDHGFRPSLSVDGETDAPSDMFTQMRTLFALQRALCVRAGQNGTDPPVLLGVEDLLEFATVAGAKANGLEHKVGTLAVGMQADVILLRTDRINVLPVSNPVGAVVLGMDTSNVDSVFVAGRSLKRDGTLVGVDIDFVSRRARASQEYLLPTKCNE